MQSAIRIVSRALGSLLGATLPAAVRFFVVPEIEVATNAEECVGLWLPFKVLQKMGKAVRAAPASTNLNAPTAIRRVQTILRSIASTDECTPCSAFHCAAFLTSPAAGSVTKDGAFLMNLGSVRGSIGISLGRIKPLPWASTAAR